MATKTETLLNQLAESTDRMPGSAERLGELMLHICDRGVSDSRLGAVKLNKLLWFSDFLAFRELGSPITGAVYVSMQNGPVPPALEAVKKDMVANGDIAIRPKRFHGYTQERIMPLRQADLQHFSGEQIAIVDRMVAQYEPSTASQISDVSHDIRWRIATRSGSPIPYESVFLSSDGISFRDVDRTQELVKKYGWAST